MGRLFFRLKERLSLLSEKQINLILFIGISITWSFTWFVGKWQVNNVIIPEVAACYRMMTMSFLVLIYCLVFKEKLKPTAYDLKTFFVYGLISCCLNFILFYYAATKMVTGVSAIVFSFSVLLNIFIGRLFGLKKDMNSKTIISGLIGIIGLILVLLPIIKNQKFDDSFCVGLVLAVVATFCFSIGSTFYESRSKISLSQTSGFVYFSFFGSFWCFLLAELHFLITGEVSNWVPNFSLPFVFSFIYMSVFSGALGYLCLFALIKRIGSVNASYSAIVSPVLAIVTSAFFEDYKFTLAAFFGIVLVTCSKFVLLLNPRKILHLFR